LPDVCTVVTRWVTDEPLRILAVRDELVSREFDDPGNWWPDQPGVVGGRDRLAGGSWCVSDVAAGTTALVLNRTEKHTGTPSRGILPLAAVAHGAAWPAQVDVTDMASFTLVVAGPDGVTAWTWDAEQLHRTDLEPGTHMMTARGVDADDAKTARYAKRFATEDWTRIVTAEKAEDDRSALLVRHEFETDTFATVLGQLLESEPGVLDVRWSRTPWAERGWTSRRFTP
jgi:uncharacterized protein with NRDE domain